MEKGLKIDPSRFEIKWVKNPEGSIFRPFPYVKAGPSLTQRRLKILLLASLHRKKTKTDKNVKNDANMKFIDY